MISKLIIQMISRKIVTAAFALATTVASAQAQAIDPLPKLEKEPAVNSVEKVKDAEIKKEQGSIGSDVVAVRTEIVAVHPPKPLVTSDLSKIPFSENIIKKSSSPAQQTSSSGWQFAFTPYLYMTGVEGTIGARGVTAEIDASFGDVIENLNLGIMGAFEARKGRFVVVNDLMWIKLGEERDTPGQLFSSVKLGVNMFIWDPEVGYRLYEGKAGTFDVLGGVRLMSVETNVNFRTGILPGFDVSERKTWATPVIGGHGTLNLSSKFYLATKFDIGGGVGADFTGQFYGGAGYRITPKIALVGGYRYLKTDYDDEEGFIFDTAMNGILLGAKFSF